MKNTASLARAIIMFLPRLWHPSWNCCCLFQDLSWNGEGCLISFGRTPSSRQCSSKFCQVIFPFEYSLTFVPRSLRWAFQEPEDCSSCEQSKYRLRLLCFHLSAPILWHFRHSMVLGHFSRLSQNTAGNDEVPLPNDGKDFVDMLQTKCRPTHWLFRIMLSDLSGTDPHLEDTTQLTQATLLS